MKFKELKIPSVNVISFLALCASPATFCLIHVCFFLLLLLSNIFDSSAVSPRSIFQTFSSVSLYPLLTLNWPLEKFTFADTQLCDSPPGCGRVQHCFVAQKPREEPQHGCPAAWSCPGIPGYNRRGKQQLRQCRTRRQLPPAGCLYCDPSPSARHHSWLLEAGLWLRLHSSGHAQPTQPVKLCLGKLKVIIFD